MCLRSCACRRINGTLNVHGYATWLRLGWPLVINSVAFCAFARNSWRAAAYNLAAITHQSARSKIQRSPVPDNAKFRAEISPDGRLIAYESFDGAKADISV